MREPISEDHAQALIWRWHANGRTTKAWLDIWHEVDFAPIMLHGSLWIFVEFFERVNKPLLERATGEVGILLSDDLEYWTLSLVDEFPYDALTVQSLLPDKYDDDAPTGRAIDTFSLN